MDRREFIKKAVQVGGVAALYNLGVTLEQARAWGVFPATVMEPTSTSYWAGWDETLESGLSADQDGDGAEDTYIAFMENTSAGGDETGQGGGLAGADLVLTQVGNIAGAVGTPPSRDFDGSDDYFSFTSSLADVLAGQATWSVIVKTADITTSTNKSEQIAYIDGANDTVAIDWSWSNDKPRFRAVKDGGNILLAQPAADDYTGTKYWAIWCDGTYVRGGYCDSKPTKWSDFAANARVSATSACQFTNGDFGSTRKIGHNAGGNYPDCDVYYVVISAACLIDNAS